MNLTPKRTLRLGAVGLGRAFASMAPSLVAHPDVRLVAVADPNPLARAHCERDFAARTHADADDLLSDPEIEAVYIATPHELHVPQTLRAFECGKHVLLEKPMAMSIQDSQRLVDAAQASGRQLVVGHSHGFDAPFMDAARLIASGAFGAVRMLTALNFTNWVYRPRRPEELAAGSAGVVLNQASHQIDIVRLLAGGLATSVRASAGVWDPTRPTVGAYAAMLQFEGGIVATLTYSGYDHFDTDEFNGWIGELGRRKEADAHGAARRRVAASTSGSSELALKAGVGYAGMAVSLKPDIVDLASQWHQQFGLVLVSCDKADLRISGQGITIYGDDGVEHRPVPPTASGGSRAGVFDELYGAVVRGQEPLHSGRWGMSNLEVCLAILQSSRTHQEVDLHHQVAAVLSPV